MKKDEIQAFYNQVYDNYKCHSWSSFDEYERNHVLRNLYHSCEDKKILDLGAGDGTISQFFLKLGYEVYGIEWTEAGVEKLKKLGVKAIQYDIENIPYDFEDGFFDEIFWGDNIEHLFFPELVAKEILRILKPGGRLILSTPNHGWIINRLFYLIKGVPRRTEGHKIPIWEWQHIRYFNKAQLINFLRTCGFNRDLGFYGAERRQPFSFLSQFFPALCGSVLIVEARK